MIYYPIVSNTPMEREISEVDKARIIIVDNGRDILNIFSDKWHAEVMALLYDHPEGLEPWSIHQAIFDSIGKTTTGIGQISTTLVKLQRVGFVVYEREAGKKLGKLSELGKIVIEGWLETMHRVVK